jgi:2-keto-4-pentenoate hydratase/2-oxohepta-3-ene-1,7-dioic acid hydratase in catechol pathway
MKLLRYGPVGQEKPGLIDSDGNIRDLSAHVADIDPGLLSPEGLAALAAIDPASLPLVEGSPRYGVPPEPIFFTKAISCLQGPNDPVMIPRGSEKTDWEVELGVVIGTRASYVTEDKALDHVAGYCTINDVSERAFQLERGGTWDKGKGCDTFGPVGPWLVTKDEVGDVQSLGMWLEVNGKRVQDGSSSTMIFGVAKLVSYVSEFLTLEPGDIITTGTPKGVGMGQKPTPWFLKAGDVIELGIEKLGRQRQDVVAWSPNGAAA